MGKIDQLTNEYMSDKARFADVFNYFVYDGRQVLVPEYLHELSTVEQVFPYGKDGKTHEVQRFRDVLKNVCVMTDEQDRTYVLLGIENQSYIHYAAPVKDMLYDAMNYVRQAERIASAHRKRKDSTTSSEFLSGFNKDDRLRPVITLMIYWSDKEWDGKLSLHEIIDFPDEKLKSFIPDYRVNLLSPSRIDDFAKFRTEISEVFRFIKCSGDKSALTALLNGNAEFRQLDRASAEVINVVTGLNFEFAMEGGKVDVCKAIEQIKETAMAEGEKKGFAQGEQHGFAQGEKQGFDRGDKHGEEKGILNSIRNLMDTMSWTAQTAMDALKIPEADRAGYLAKL
jgi:hypothetical protein